MGGNNQGPAGGVAQKKQVVVRQAPGKIVVAPPDKEVGKAELRSGGPVVPETWVDKLPVVQGQGLEIGEEGWVGHVPGDYMRSRR